jgi:hypothetical protein
MLSKMFRWVAALALLLASASTALAEGKVEIGVVFEVKAKHFTNALGADADAFAAKAKAAIIEVLDRHLKFVVFTDNPQAAYLLNVVLASPDMAEQPSYSAFGFHLQLSGPGIPPSAKDYVEFRPKERFLDPVGSADALARETDDVIDKIDYRAFVARFLSEIPIADGADFHNDQGQTSWQIKESRLALCLGYDSLLRIQSQFPYSGRTRKDWFPAKVIDLQDDANIYAETTGAPLLSSADATQVKGLRVSVADYYLCDAPVPASATTFPDAGGNP